MPKALHRKAALFPFSSSIPNTTEQVMSDHLPAECSAGLAGKTVQHDRAKKRKFSLLSQSYQKMCSRVEAKKGGYLGSSGGLKRETTLQMKTHLY